MLRTIHGVGLTLRKGIIGGLVLASVLSAPYCAADEPTIYKIEEDWEMVIHEPDRINVSPQITFSMSPGTNEHNCYFQLQMNYFADEQFSAGGFHVAAFHDDEIADEARSKTQIVLATHHDHIRWTSVMAVVDGKAMFAVRDGHGDEWGDFGGPDYLVKLPTCPVDDLSGYHPQTSLDNVDISFGANRVDSVTLIQVKLFYTDGNTVTLPMNASP
jgi:hypothetical protein